MVSSETTVLDLRAFSANSFIIFGSNTVYARLLQLPMGRRPIQKNCVGPVCTPLFVVSIMLGTLAK